MVRSKIIVVKNLGPVLLERSVRARRMNVSIKAEGRVRVAVPEGVSFRAARKFLYSRLDWIGYHLGRIRKLEREKAAEQPAAVNRVKARLFLVNRLDELSGEYGYKYNKVFVRNQRTIWGSCSAQNNINLNMNLVRLPGELIDYVILHELVHIRHKNHSKRFWDELDKLVGDGKEMQRKLRVYRIGG